MRLFRHELEVELLLYTRSRELAFFTFLLPMIFFVLLGSAYGNDTVDGDQGLEVPRGGDARLRRRLDRVRRARDRARDPPRDRDPQAAARDAAAGLRRTSPPAASTLFAFAVEVVAIIVLGRVLFDVAVPDHSVSLVLALLLGAVAFAALGVG